MAGEEKPKIEKVREWLMKAGYPLEMRVARAFTMVPSFNRVVLGEIYESKDRPGTHRAIDVSAQMGVSLYRPKALRGTDVTMWVDLFAVVECKSNPKGTKPWLVFSDPTHPTDSRFTITTLGGTELGRWLFKELSLDSDFNELPLFTAPRIGYAVKCANLGESNPNPRENNQDTAYEAVMEVLSAARAKADIQASDYRIFRIVIPVIVVGADLYECWLDHGGEMQLESRDEMALLYKTKPGVDAAAHAMIYIVTEAKLPDLIQRIRRAHDELTNDEELLLKGCKQVPPDPEPPDDL